jgi:diguanylate cyclase (GGDEF)-like protein
MELYYYISLFVATLIFWIFIETIYSKKHNDFIKNFLNANTNISILYNNDKIVFINSIGLEFFSYASVDEFNREHADLSQLFLSEDDCIDKHTYGKKWIELLKENNGNYLKVKLYSKRDKMNYYFNINISNVKKNNYYLISFHDITKLESERANIIKLAENDALTNVYNRVKFNQVLSDMIYRANRYHLKFSIILLDIDHFKSINDEYGHNIGDKVLIELSGLIKISLRESDVFARWGGEEFVIIAESTNLKEVSHLASKLRQIVAGYRFKEVDRVTCSFGVTEFKVGDTQALLFERVDKALYEAKHNGRNQVVSK